MSASKILLITGGNTGLGYETLRALCTTQTKYEILLGGRSLQKAQKAVESLTTEFPDVEGRISPIQVDVESDDSIKAAFETVKDKHGRLDILVNNAGAQFDQQLAAGTMTMRQVWSKSWEVNTVGTQIMTDAFVPLLLKSSDARLLFIASGTSTLAESDNPYIPVNKSPPKGWPKPAHASLPAYRSAKTGMNMMMREWCRILKEDGVKIWCVSPGWLATGLGGNREAMKKAGAGDPTVGAHFIKDVIEGQRDADVGKVITKDRVQPW